MTRGFSGTTAIVTGGASGIGRAIGLALVREGATVVLADIDREGAERVAGEATGPGRARAATLDVTDADAFAALVGEVAGEGKLDLLVNNAGIAVFGDVARYRRESWDRQIDVNVRGVVHGVAAAYPVMIRQGDGHILNVASAAGLAPTPGATGYAMTKHAVVGLSTSLRVEASLYGVRVSVLCPGFVDTPIAQRLEFAGDLDRAKLLREFPLKLHSADRCAQAALRGVARNRAIIPFTAFARIGWWCYRMAPRTMLALSKATARFSPLLGQAPTVPSK